MENFFLFLVLAYFITQLPYILLWAYNKRLISISVDNMNKVIQLSAKISAYFQLFNTLIHELGHIFVAHLTLNKVYKIELSSDRAGLATTSARNKLTKILISLGGYTTSSVFVVFYMSMLNLELYSLLLYIVGGILVFSLIFYVRNAFGIFWCILMTGLVWSIGRFGTEALMIKVIILLGAILVIESIVSSLILIEVNRKNNATLDSTNSSNDAKDLAEETKIPAMVWSVFFTSFAFICAYIGIRVAFSEPFESVQELLSFIASFCTS